MDPGIDPQLARILRSVAGEQAVAVFPSFKHCTRDPDKLLKVTVMEFVLCYGSAFVTPNWYLANGYVAPPARGAPANCLAAPTSRRHSETMHATSAASPRGTGRHANSCPDPPRPARRTQSSASVRCFVRFVPMCRSSFDVSPVAPGLPTRCRGTASDADRWRRLRRAVLCCAQRHFATVSGELDPPHRLLTKTVF